MFLVLAGNVENPITNMDYVNRDNVPSLQKLPNFNRNVCFMHTLHFGCHYVFVTHKLALENVGLNVSGNVLNNPLHIFPSDNFRALKGQGLNVVAIGVTHVACNVTLNRMEKFGSLCFIHIVTISRISVVVNIIDSETMPEVWGQ